MMLKLIIKLITLAFSVVLLGLVIILSIPTDRNHYMNAVKDKHEHLSQIAGPKLVIIGGSNTAFGIDSESIEKEIGRPVFNMGIHVGLGWEFILNEVKPYLNPGDKILISPEYAHMFWNTTSGFDPSFYKTLEVYPSAIQYLPKRNIPRSLSLAYVELLQSKIKNLIFRNGELESAHIKRNKHIYLRDNYNVRGDMTAHLEELTQHYNKNDDTFSSFDPSKILPEFYKLTNAFTAEMNDKDIGVYLSYAPTPSSIYDKEKGLEIHRNLSENLNLIILGEPSDMVFEDNLFFDTRYHLIDESRKERTAYLIRQLKSLQ